MTRESVDLVLMVPTRCLSRGSCAVNGRLKEEEERSVKLSLDAVWKRVRSKSGSHFALRPSLDFHVATPLQSRFFPTHESLPCKKDLAKVSEAGPKPSLMS